MKWGNNKAHLQMWKSEENFNELEMTDRFKNGIDISDTLSKAEAATNRHQYIGPSIELPGELKSSLDIIFLLSMS